MSIPGEMSSNPKRNRIVINLDEPAGRAGSSQRNAGNGMNSQRPKRRGLFVKVLAFIGIVVIVVLVGAIGGGYFWWQSYKARPAYSLALLVDAVQRNDTQAFDQMIDIDSIANNLGPQIADRATSQYTSALPAGVRKQIESVVPRSLPAIKQRVHDEVAGQAKELSARAAGRSVPVLALAISYLAAINQTGDSATALIQLPNRTIDLSMRRNGDRWKVVGVKDDALTQRIIDGLARDLPAVGPPITKDSKKNGKAGVIPLPDVRIPGIR